MFASNWNGWLDDAVGLRPDEREEAVVPDVADHEHRAATRLQRKAHLPLDVGAGQDEAVVIPLNAGSIKRVATAVGEGAMSVRLVHDRLASSPYVVRR